MARRSLFLPPILADGAGASTIVYGPPIDDWARRAIAGQQVVLLCNGKPRRAGSAASAVDNPMVPLTWLAEGRIHRHELNIEMSRR
jgi:2-keto-4-pentenoate hydratase